MTVLQGRYGGKVEGYSGEGGTQGYELIDMRVNEFEDRRLMNGDKTVNQRRHAVVIKSDAKAAVSRYVH